MATSSFYNSSGSTPAVENSIQTAVTQAAGSATQAATSATQASTSATNAQNSLNSFQQYYLGAYTSAPSTSQLGAMYFDTGTSQLYIWSGSSWDVTASANNLQNTDGLTEGSSNLYFTDERVDDRVNALLTAGSNVTLTYDDAANTLTIDSTATGTSGSTTFIGLTDTPTTFTGQAYRYLMVNSTEDGIATVTPSTDDVSEGTSNLYYTDARADARIAAAGYITASSTDTLTNKSGNISQWTNDSNYLTSITGQSLYSLSNVNTSASPTDGQVLSWDNANSYWTPTAASSGGGGTGDTTHIRYSSSTGQNIPFNIGTYHSQGTTHHAYTGQRPTKDGNSGQGISVSYTAIGSQLNTTSTVTYNPTYKITLTNNTGSTINLRRSADSSTPTSLELKFTTSSYNISAGTYFRAMLEPPTAVGTTQPVQMFLPYLILYGSGSLANTGTQLTLSATTLNNWDWYDGEDLVFYIALTTLGNNAVVAVDVTLDELTLMYAGATSTYNSSTTTTQGIRLNFAYERQYSTLNTAPAATDSLIGFYDGVTASTNGNDYDWTVFVEEPNSALAADDMLIYSTSNGWTYGKPSLYALSNVNTSSAPTNGQVLTWDSTNSYWTPSTSSGSGATTLSGLNDVSNAIPANGQVLTWDNSTSLWQPINPSGGIALTDLSASNTAPANATLSYNSSTGQFIFTPPDLSPYLQNINSESLADLSDVNNATPIDGQVLTWDNANSYWKPATVSSSGGSSQSPNIVTGTFTTTSTSYVDAGEIVDTDDGFTGMFEVIVSAQIGTGSSASAWYGKLQVAYNKEAPGQTNWMTTPWFGNGTNSGSSGHNISAVRIQPRWDTSTNKIYLQVKNGSSTSTVYNWTATLI